MATLFGVPVTDIDRRSKGQGASFSLTFEFVNFKDWKAIENLEEEFTEKYKLLFKDLVAEIHKYLIRVTPLHSGELRGGWTAYLEKYRYNYARQIFEHSLYDEFKALNVTPEYKEYNPSQDSVESGKQKSSVEDGLPNETDVTIENRVGHAESLEFGTKKIVARHTTERAIYRGEQWFTEHFNEWFNMISAAGAVVDPPQVEEID